MKEFMTPGTVTNAYVNLATRRLKMERPSHVLAHIFLLSISDQESAYKKFLEGVSTSIEAFSDRKASLDFPLCTFMAMETRQRMHRLPSRGAPTLMAVTLSCYRQTPLPRKLISIAKGNVILNNQGAPEDAVPSAPQSIPSGKSRWLSIAGLALPNDERMMKNSGATWWIFVCPGRALVKNLVNNKVPPGLLQSSV